MSAYCEICQKGAMSGMNVSHSHLKTKRKWKPNIQRVRAVVNGEIKRVNVAPVVFVPAKFSVQFDLLTKIKTPRLQVG